MKRVLALLGACLLVAGAVVARGALDDDDEDGGDGPNDDGELVVACIPELRDACEAIERDIDELRIEDPAETIASVAAGEDVDAWVTLDPWPEIANERERRQLFADFEAVARSDLVLIARTAQIPSGRCVEELTWTCLVDDVGEDIAVPRTDSALGLLVLGHAAITFFGPGLAANDFGDADFARRLGRLDVESDPLGDIRVGLPVPLATGTVEADLAALANRIDDFTVSTGGGAAASVAVVVVGADADRIAGEPSFTDALEDLGWALDPDAATTGLPSAGVLFALGEQVG